MAGPVDRSSIMAGPVTRAPTSQYSPEELDAIAKADPRQKLAVKESIDARKRIAAGETPTIVEAQQFPTPRNLLAEKAPTQQAPTSQYSPEELDAIAKAHPLQKTAVKESIDAQKRLEIEKRGREAVADRYKRKVAGLDIQAPISEDGPIQEELVSPLGAIESEAEVIPEVLSTPSGMQYGGELPLVTSEQIARATEIERRRREAVARKYRRGLGYASSELTGQRNPFAGGGMVYDYAGGGEVAARGLASLGRGPDTELVHMSPQEVGALDDLARTTGLRGLPVNPQTGLPEAGIFDSILPIAIGAGAAALAPFTGGASLLANPFFVGGMSALGAGIASGFDTAQMAKWGLGVGGGAGLYGSLAGAGAGAGSAGATQVGGTMPAVTTEQIARQTAIEQGGLGAVKAQGANVADAFSREGAKQLFGVGAREATLGLPTVAAGLGSMAASEYKDPPKFTPVGLPTTDPTYPKGGYRAPPRKSIDPFRGERTVADRGEEIYFDPEPYTYPGYMPNEIPTSREDIASTEIPNEKVGGIFGEMAQQYEDFEAEKRRRQAQGLYYAREGGIVPYSNGGEVADTGEATYFAPDRVTTLPQAAVTAASGPDVARMMQNAQRWQNASDQGVHIRDYAHMSEKERNKYGDPYYGSALEGRKATGIEAIVPPGGVDQDIGELVYFNQGGLTQGPGDGMSDDIMLPITGTPDIAAVSPDEFVVPADVVSGLGNGSTSAGARQLYSMMDKVRDARTGKTAQPRAINPARMMPV
jgi:hypothetical protein